MATPRSKLVCLQSTPYYHCTSRCVRGAFLCGQDKLSEKNFDHRRSWIEKRLLFLARIFCIDVCAYAVMSNHCHVVLRINERLNKELSDLDVAKRWLGICKGTLVTQQFVQGKSIEKHFEDTLKETLLIYRSRLMDLSWFMRMLNEPIARMANDEDECTGRFWEGRFYSQALLDETALAACMAYVDLNPVRAGIEKTPENSQYTSVQKRIQAAKQQKQLQSLMPFVGNPRKNKPEGLPFKLDEYLSLLDITGRCIREDKKGFIDNNLPKILERLNIPAQSWITLTTRFETAFPGVAGNAASLDLLIEIEQRKRRCNLHNSQALFG